MVVNKIPSTAAPLRLLRSHGGGIVAFPLSRVGVVLNITLPLRDTHILHTHARLVGVLCFPLMLQQTILIQSFFVNII